MRHARDNRILVFEVDGSAFALPFSAVDSVQTEPGEPGENALDAAALLLGTAPAAGRPMAIGTVPGSRRRLLCDAVVDVDHAPAGSVHPIPAYVFRIHPPLVAALYARGETLVPVLSASVLARRFDADGAHDG